MPKKKWFWNDIADGLLRRLYDPTVRGRSPPSFGRPIRPITVKQLLEYERVVG